MNQGTRIAVVRRAHEITQGELGKMCLITQPGLSMIETGARKATDGQLSDIRTALGWGPEIDAALDALEWAIMQGGNDDTTPD